VLAVLQLAYAAQTSNALGGAQTTYLQQLEEVSRANDTQALRQFLSYNKNWKAVTRALTPSQRQYWFTVLGRNAPWSKLQWLEELLVASTENSLKSCTDVLLRRLGVEGFDGIFVGKIKCK
jgi:hypothetical protein